MKGRKPGWVDRRGRGAAAAASTPSRQRSEASTEKSVLPVSGPTRRGLLPFMFLVPSPSPLWTLQATSQVTLSVTVAAHHKLTLRPKPPEATASSGRATS